MGMNVVACVPRSLQLYRCSIAIWFNVVVGALAVDKRLIAVLPLHPQEHFWPTSCFDTTPFYISGNET
jgi:hypothetical protein